MKETHYISIISLVFGVVSTFYGWREQKRWGKVIGVILIVLGVASIVYEIRDEQQSNKEYAQLRQEIKLLLKQVPQDKSKGKENNQIKKLLLILGTSTSISDEKKAIINLRIAVEYSELRQWDSAVSYFDETYRKTNFIDKPDQKTELLAWIAFGLGKIDKERSTYLEAIEHFNLAERYVQSITDKSLIPYIQYYQADLLTTLGKPSEALELYDKAVREFNKANNFELVALILSGKSRVFRDLGDGVKTISYAEESNNISEPRSNLSKQYRLITADNFKEIGAQLRRDADLLKLQDKEYNSILLNSEKKILRAQLIYQELEDSNYPYAIAEMGHIQRVRGDYPQALERFQTALQLFQKHQNWRGVANETANIANIKSMIGDYNGALIDLEKALEIFDRIQFLDGRAMALSMVGKCYYLNGDRANAIKYLKMAGQQYQDIKNTRRAHELNAFALDLSVHKK